MTDIVITHARRTPIGKFGGALSSLSAVQMGTHAIKAVLDKSGVDPARVGQVLMGHARQAGCGPNPARQAAIHAGIPDSAVAWTINQACASGTKAVVEGAKAIANGEAEIVIAGGMESMSNVPFMVEGMRDGLRLGNKPLTDLMYRDGFHCPLADQLMGRTAETLAEKYDISREEQDEFSCNSHNKAEAAITDGRLQEEIEPITIKTRKGETVIDRDEPTRFGQTIEAQRKLKPVFKEGGTVTAANASGITDGASAVMLMSAATAKELGYTPMARIEGSACAGIDPKVMGLGPVPSTQALMKKLNLSIEDFDLIELNEAFAAQVLACDRELKMPRDRLNVNGGAISLGHPIGNTGARIIVTLLYEMQRRDAKRGLATLCVSGGLGAAVSLVREA